MHRKTKYIIIAVLVFLIILAASIWYKNFPRIKYVKLQNLVSITYQPQPPPTVCSPACTGNSICLAGICTSAYPTFVYTFSKPGEFTDQLLSQGTLSLKSFTLIGADQSDTQKVQLVELLIKNNVPFTGDIVSNTEIGANVMPMGILQKFQNTVTVNGIGELTLTIPPKKD